MFRRRSSDKAKVEPEICVLLRNLARYPGDKLQGVVIVDFASPIDILTLEVRLYGEERTTLGGLLITGKNPEARKTIYYEQFITLRGVDHDALEKRRSLLGRCRTVVSQDAMMRKSSPNAVSLSNHNNSVAGAPSPEGPSTENSISDLTPSIINATVSTGNSVHLVPGTYSFPFKVTLPDALPQTRELHRAREGVSVLRYRAVATMILTGGKVYTAETPFRINALPVQVQRWYELHGDERNSGDSSEADDAAGADIGPPIAESGSARPGLKSRLLSSPGTISTDAADREREVTCQRRIRHYRQFPEHQLLAERAEYEKRAEAQKTNSTADDNDAPFSPQAAKEMMTAEKSSSRMSPPTYRERRARQDEAENRSLNGTGDKGFAAATAFGTGADAGDDDQDNDEVHAFVASAESRGATPPPPERDSSGNLAATVSAGEANTSKEKKKKKHRHHSKNGDDGGTNDSALVANNVEQLAYTPPDEELAPLPAHLAVRHSVDTTAAAASSTQQDKKPSSSHRKKGGKKVGDEGNEGGGEDEEAGAQQSQRTQAHTRRSRFVPPPWCQEFNISLRGGFLRTGKVKVKLSLRSPLVSVGYGKVMVKVLVDNSDGGGNITKVKYSLITRCYIRTKTEVFNFHVDTVETLTDVSIEKGSIVAIPEVELPVPKSTPLTMLTEGMGTLTFLNVRLYVGTALKTFSKSVETEVVLVSGLDSQNSSRRLLSWTCFYRRRNSEDTRELTVRPPTINLSEQNAKVRVMQGSELAWSASASFLNNSADTDTSSMAPSAMSRSLSIMRSSKRVAKNAPSLDARRLASALNYDEAIFVPPAEDQGPAGSNSHVDPMAMLNPFAMPSANVGSTLPSVDREDTDQQ
jgi:hypothetical protein